MEVIELDGIGDVRVLRSANIKYLSVRMAPGKGIWVNVPCGVSRRQTEKFLMDNLEWIIRKKESMEVYEKSSGPELKIGSEVKTKFHLFRIESTDAPNPSYRKEQKTITLSIPRRMEPVRVEMLTRRFLVDIYKMECRRYLPGRVDFWAGKCGFHYGRLSFRDNVSRWGSCSFRNDISLNIKLMKLPDEIIDYVILHELCHTVEKNHSEAFWKLVGRFCPDYVRLRKSLRSYNAGI